MSHTIKILISNQPRTRKFSQPLQVEKAVAFDFSHYGHALVTLYVQFLCSDWSKFDRWAVSSCRKFTLHLETSSLIAEGDRVLCHFVMLLTVIFNSMYKMKFTAAIMLLLLFMAGLFIGFLFEKWATCQSSQKFYFRLYPIVFKMSLLTSPCLMPAILSLQLDGYQSNVVYVASLCTFVRFETMI